MGMGFKPAHQRVALSKLQFFGFGQAMQPSAQLIGISFAGSRKKSNATYAGRIGQRFDNGCHKHLDIVQTTKDSRKSKQWKRPCYVDRLLCSFALAGDLRRHCRCLAQIADFLLKFHIIESAPEKRLKTSSFQAE